MFQTKVEERKILYKKGSYHYFPRSNSSRDNWATTQQVRLYLETSEALFAAKAESSRSSGTMSN